MDITFHADDAVFNCRAAAIILHNEKLLVMHDQRSPYAYLPGGRVQIGETAEVAVLREIQEELGIQARIQRLLWINQAFFTEDLSHEKYHELCFYFLIDVSGSDLLTRKESFEYLEGGNKRLRYDWLSFNALESAYFYPEFLKTRIRALPETAQLITNYD